jgi:PBP1b-binding outer membrane lipoprotein LpoB
LFAAYAPDIVGIREVTIDDIPKLLCKRRWKMFYGFKRRSFPAVSRHFVLISIFSALIISGCSTPNIQTTSFTRVLQPDEEDDIGGTFLESGDIRTVAQRMTGSLLSSQAVSSREGTVRIAIAPIRNSTRFIVDKDIFTKRLRIDLNKVAEGRLRFFAQGVGQETRGEILREQDKEVWESSLEDVAAHFSRAPTVANAQAPIKVAVITVRNTNIAGVNADTLTALLRSQISEKAHGKIVFLGREENGKVIRQILAESDLRHLGLVGSERNKSISGVDYFLGGEFIAKTLTRESAQLTTESKLGTSKEDPGTVELSSASTIKRPNVETYLNVMLIDAQTGVIPVEKMVRVEREMKSGLGKADLILTGELSALSKGAEGGNRSDYVLLSFQLVDPQSNELLWEDSYETKKVSNKSVIYK